MEKNIQETLSSVSDATLQKDVKISVDILPQSRIHKLLQGWGIAKRKRVFSIRPIVLGNLIRISKILLKIDPNALDQSQMIASNYALMMERGDQIAEVIAIALQNNKYEADRWLVDFVKENFSSIEIYTVLMIVRAQMHVQPFMTSIILIRGLNVTEKTNGVKVNPVEQGGSIAPGTL